MEEIILKRKIYPDIDENMAAELDNLKVIFGIEVDFLLDDGIRFIYDPSITTPKNFPGDISFYGSKNDILLTIEDSFGELVFTNSSGEAILTIPTFESMIIKN